MPLLYIWHGLLLNIFANGMFNFIELNGEIPSIFNLFPLTN